MPTVLVKSGAMFDVRAWGTDDRCDLLDFLTDAKTVEAADRKAIAELVIYSAEYGPPKHDKTRCRSVGDGIYEFKAPRGARVLWFYSAGSIIVCTHGFLKKRQRTPPTEIVRAKRIRTEYWKETGRDHS